MTTKITWFRHNHENRNDLLRFALMQLHYDGAIEYCERGLPEADQKGFSKAVTSYKDPRHMSFLIVKRGKESLRCIVDNEDSFALISPLITEADIYFSAGYNSDFFQKKQFIRPYPWQDDTDLAWYKRTIEAKIEQLGSHFYKIRKFIPIAPNLAHGIALPAWKRKIRNIEHKLYKRSGRSYRFSDDYQGFRIRYDYMLNLRNESLLHDIVLNDSLWGWPEHRINLHTQLTNLHARGYKVYSSLKWTDPVDEDGSKIKKVNPSRFPMVTTAVNGNYELMLSQSRLAVFACGFHWGWRNIMLFALMTGIPVLTDRLLTEAYFDLNEFKIFQQEDHQWTGIQEHLDQITEDTWRSIKSHNQAVYDKYMSPTKVGEYFLQTVLNQ